MMTSSEFKTLIERNVGTIYFEDTISKNRFSQLSLFLEKELDVKISDQWTSSMTYIDLWRKVNTLTEAQQSTRKKKKAKMKSKEPEKEEKTSVIIPEKKGSSVFPFSLKVAKKLKDISDKIDSDNNELEAYLGEIQNAEPSIDIGSFLGIAKKRDIESSIYDVYSSLCDYVVKCGDAIRASNGNISNVLELIQLLTAAEADLYQWMDNQAIQSNELRALIKDWCKEHGIHDDEVDKLLESSFQRAYTLRDRLNNLREDIYNELSNNKESIENILKELPNYQIKIQKSTDDALSIIEESKEKNINDIDHHYTEKEQELQAKYDLLTLNANNLIENIAVKKKNIDENEAEFVKKVTDRKSVV